MNTLKVSSVEERTSEANKCQYKVVVVTGIKEQFGKQVETNKRGTLVFWPAHNSADGKMNFKGDVLFDSVHPGMLIEGKIVPVPTTPYALEGRAGITQVTVTVLEGQNPLTVAAKAIAQYGARPIDEEGNEFILQAPKATGSIADKATMV